MLYIYKIHEETVYSLWERQVIVHKEKARLRYLSYKTLTEATIAQPIVMLLPFALVYIAFSKYLIITIHHF